MKKKIQSLAAALIEKHELTFGGEFVMPDVDRVETHGEQKHVFFEDESIAYLIAGYVAASIYDELDSGLADLGYQADDSDGCTWIISKISAYYS